MDKVLSVLSRNRGEKADQSFFHLASSTPQVKAVVLSSGQSEEFEMAQLRDGGSSALQVHGT